MGAGVQSCALNSGSRRSGAAAAAFRVWRMSDPWLGRCGDLRHGLHSRRRCRGWSGILLGSINSFVPLHVLCVVVLRITPCKKAGGSVLVNRAMFGGIDRGMNVLIGTGRRKRSLGLTGNVQPDPAQAKAVK